MPTEERRYFRCAGWGTRKMWSHCLDPCICVWTTSPRTEWQRGTQRQEQTTLAEGKMAVVTTIAARVRWGKSRTAQHRWLIWSETEPSAWRQAGAGARGSSEQFPMVWGHCRISHERKTGTYCRGHRNWTQENGFQKRTGKKGRKHEVQKLQSEGV